MPRVLIVEDNEDNREMLRRRLERKGFEIVLALNGEEGLEKAHSAAPDLILLDMSLPRMDGWTVARILREQAVQTPILALTAHAMQGDRERALQAGCDDYDIKPVEFVRLQEKMTALLSRS
jgi:two-component system, cell cycle response regulator DivK